jgi:hypothetical protein
MTPPDILAAIERAERDVAAAKEPSWEDAAQAEYDEWMAAKARLAALGELSVPLARAVWDAHSGRDQLGAGCEVCEALLTWTQAGEERGT